ncbi:hypothetical protein E5Q_00291 [Mixia osmundae IAM 14324]|uniref:Lysophospholipase n=1 Tax=Mixia osmundae (strain CBS 9802 / IAM 14324 / JCM 22182 / KY 12970) TaxID=764103 RepID=G7DST7_MIXOS|nr:hypothetical protein E5Q_00291 [Mixia osmundae IAM 14324]
MLTSASFLGFRCLSLLLLAHSLDAAAIAPLPGAVSSGYAPTMGACPSTPLVRDTGSPLKGSQAVSAEEAAYVASRQATLPTLWNTYISSTGTGYTKAQFTKGYPNFGIAVSGGGERAALYGAGALSAFDARNSSAVRTKTAGLLQLASRITGLSGGSWIVGSLASRGLPTLSSLVFGGDSSPNGWILQKGLFETGDPAGDAAYYANILHDVEAKRLAGFPVSLTDVFGRTIAYHFDPGTTIANFYSAAAPNHAAALDFGPTIKSTMAYTKFQMPYPLIVVDSLQYDTEKVDLSDPVYEIGPAEFANYDPILSRATNLTYLGTEINNGKPVGQCAMHFSNLGFVQGSSASLFVDLVNNITSIAAQLGLAALADELQATKALTARYPNPFEGQMPSTYEESNQPVISIVDGGLNLENVPFAPHLVKARNTDVILALDASADTSDNHPDGASLIATSQRASMSQGYFSFPPVPSSTGAFQAGNYSSRPTFFGCKCESTTASQTYPLVIYLPNRPIGAGTTTNYSTFTLSYTLAQQSSFFDYAHTIASSGIPTADGGSDPAWGTCLACAVLDRARNRAGPLSLATVDSLAKVHRSSRNPQRWRKTQIIVAPTSIVMAVKTKSAVAKKPRKQREILSCDHCRAKKLKCDRLMPCGACKTRKVLCSNVGKRESILASHHQELMADTNAASHRSRRAPSSVNLQTPFSDDDMTDADGEAEAAEIDDDSTILGEPALENRSASISSSSTLISQNEAHMGASWTKLPPAFAHLERIEIPAIREPPPSHPVQDDFLQRVYDNSHGRTFKLEMPLDKVKQHSQYTAMANAFDSYGEQFYSPCQTDNFLAASDFSSQHGEALELAGSSGA